MLLVPDASRYWIDPFMSEKTLCLIADVVDPITKEGYWLDPAAGPPRRELHKFTGLADTINFWSGGRVLCFPRRSLSKRRAGGRLFHR